MPGKGRVEVCVMGGESSGGVNVSWKGRGSVVWQPAKNACCLTTGIRAWHIPGEGNARRGAGRDWVRSGASGGN